MSAYELEAIRFEHYTTLIDFVRLLGRGGSGAFELIACAQGDEAEASLYLLGRSDRPWPAHPSWPAVKARVEGETVQLPRRGRRGVETWRRVSSRTAERLPALIGPVRAQAGEPEPGVVVFWCREQGLFKRLVAMNFQMGCDRLQATVAEREGERAFLLRAERPSYYAVDLARAEAEAEVFVPQADGALWVPYGSVHPLAGLWEGDGERWCFMEGLEAQARLFVMPPPRWEDIYGLTRFTLEGLQGEERWAPDPRGEAVRFEVPLVLIPAHRPREAQVWMLRAEEHHHLERLLTLVPERDLQALHFSAQEGPGGERLYLLRERHTGLGREYIDFQGRPFAPYAGYPNLLLEVSETLEPPLRKDRYRELFELRARELVLIWSEDGRPRLVRVAEGSFRPLPELVDYLVGAGMEAFKTLEAQAVFDFARYEIAPRRPTAAAPARPEGARPTRAVEEVEELEEAEVLPAARPVEVAARPDLVLPDAEESGEDEEEATSGLEREELELEHQLVLEGQTSAGWAALAAIKHQLGKPEEAALGAREALWLSFAERGDAAALEAQVRGYLERLGSVQLHSLPLAERRRRAAQRFAEPEADVAWLWLHLAYEREALQSPGDAAARDVLTRGYATLEARGKHLRVKDRWLLWRQLLTLNQDAVQEAKLREATLTELTRSGLQPFDVPGFIQNRIYQLRFFQEDDAEAEGEFIAANAILDQIAARLEKAEDEALRRIGVAILAYGYERLGNRSRSDHYAGQAEAFFEAGTGLEPVEQAWLALYMAALREHQAPQSGGEWVKRYNQRLKLQASAGLAHSELETIQKAIFTRAAASNPSEFFSPENFRSLFPMAGKYTDAQQIKRSLDEHVAAGAFAQALEELRRLAVSAEAGTLRLDARQFAWLLGPITDTLRKIGQASEGIGILEQLERGADRVRQGSLLGLYNTLLRLRLAEGFLDLGDEARGADMIRTVVHGVYREKGLQWLDHLDMLGAALGGIELVPLLQRGEGVHEILNALFIDEKHPQDSGTYRPIKLRLIDHCMEVALSKDKLSLKRYKLYLDEDEYHVRHRIVNDRIAGQG